jgi:GntR family transcriptional regulator
VPRWLAIRESIQRDIEVGRLPAGTTIPSERELAARYHVSRMTVRQALSSFAANGTLLPQQGRGTVVAPPSITKNALGLASFSEEMRRRGLTPSSRVLSCALAIASPEQIAALQLSTPETVLVLRRVRLADGDPLALERCVIPIRLVPALDRHDFAAESLYEVLMHEYTIQPSHALETVTSRPATAEECRLLEMTPPAALLSVRRQTFTSAHQLFESVESLYRGDAYSIAIHLQRVPERSGPGKEVE